MSAEKNLRVIEDMYAAFGRGDVGFVLDQIHDECDGFGVISRSPTGVPWHLGTSVKGKEGAARYFEALAKSVDHEVFEPRDLAATGDHVYSTVRLVMRVHATGQRLELPEVMHHFTFRDGRVVRCRASEDTAATMAAFVK